jgi:hypothetical protein
MMTQATSGANSVIHPKTGFTISNPLIHQLELSKSDDKSVQGSLIRLPLLRQRLE